MIRFPCSYPGCSELAVDDSRCDQHPRPSGWEKGQDERRKRYRKGWHKIRKFVLRRDAYLCQLCEAANAQEVDHVVPFCQGGTNRKSNLQAICVPCHRDKTKREARNGRMKKEIKS